MPVDENPTGVAYLQTFQALFQIVEFLSLLVTWSLVVSQKFYVHVPLSFAVGVLLFIWLVTLFFFFMYITGFSHRLNDCCSRLRTSSATDTDDTTSPRRTGVVWYVAEYSIYLFLDLFLLISVIIVSAFTINSHFIAAAAFGWFTFLVYTFHFCLLVKTTEGVWPHTLAAACYNRIAGKGRNTESESLIPSQPPEPSHTEP